LCHALGRELTGDLGGGSLVAHTPFAFVQAFIEIQFMHAAHAVFSVIDFGGGVWLRCVGSGHVRSPSGGFIRSTTPAHGRFRVF
jgi:hypothetical protein